MNKLLFTCITCILLLTSCFEVSDEITITKTGNGTYNRTTDYSALVEAFKSMSSLSDSTKSGDSAVTQITRSLDSSWKAQFEIIKSTPGITNATMWTDLDRSKFNMHFDFSSVTVLNQVFSNINGGSAVDYFKWKKGSLILIGGIPGLLEPKVKPAEEGDETARMMMQDAKYNLRIFAGSKIKSTSNNKYKIESNKKSIVLQTKFNDVMESPKINSTIILYK